ncbi:MAG TPA: hypothetical protein PLE60_13230 [Candidatus Latescibacteria bacterium]|nr:hypothetical protein [Candidatus Latescibacterota bacterium]
MPIETVIKIHQTGVWLVVASAIMLIVATTVAVRLAPGVVLPLLVVAWVCGLAGFAIVCYVQPSAVNILLAVLFLASAGFHGWRIVKRIRAASSSCNDPTHNHSS